VVVAGLAVLAASSQATITFSAYTSDFSLASGASNQINSTPPQLSNFPMGIGVVTDTGHFDLSSSTMLTALDVNEVDGFAIGGSVTLTVTLYNGSTAASGVLAVLYSGSGVNGALIPYSQDNLVSLTGTHYVDYSATFTGVTPGAIGYLGGFAVDAYEAVPEPAAYATLGIGVIGLLASRRRSRK
jgi:hypothetical protein